MALRVLGVDVAVGATGTTGLGAVEDGALCGRMGPRAVRGLVRPGDKLRVFRELWEADSLDYADRVVVVEWPFIPGGACDAKARRSRQEEALNLAGVAGGWVDIASLLGARVLTPSETMWRPWLADRFRELGLGRLPRNRDGLKEAAVRVVERMFGEHVAHHVAQAICMAMWGEQRVRAEREVGFTVSGQALRCREDSYH